MRSIARLTATLFFTLLATAPSGALPRAKERWIELRTPHFTILSAAGEATAQKVAIHLEQMRAVFGQITRFDLDSPVPTWVYVFATDRQFTPYKPLHDGRPLQAGGYFLRHEGGSYIAINGDFVTDPVSTVYHEYTHFVVRKNLPDLPLWLNEGLAEYFSSFRIRGGKAEVGRAIEEHVLWLRQNRLIPLPELFAMDSDSPGFQEGKRRGVFYAQSWALVHYFLVGRKEKSDEFLRFLELSSENEGVEEAFAGAFGIGTSRLETEIAGYVRRPSLGWVTVPIDEVEIPAFKVRPLERYEVLGRLGDLLVRVEDHEAEATDHFQAALAERPGDPAAGDPVAMAGLGYLAELDERFEEALDLYKAVTASAEADFMTLYRHAWLLVDQGTAQASEARELLRRSVAKNPSFPPAWSLLAYVYTLEGEPPPEAVEAAETARRLLPESDEAVENLLAIYAGRGDSQAIEELMQRDLVGRSAPQLYERARTFLLEAKLRESQAFVREGRREEVRASLEQLPGETEDWEGFGASSFAARYNKALALMGSGDFAPARTLLQELAAASDGAEAERARELLAQVEAAAGVELHNRFAEVYNRAVARFNARDYAAGARILEELLATLPEVSREAKKARDLLERLRSELLRRDG